MKYICFIFLIVSLSTKAQYSIKVKKEDNRFLFFQIGKKTDTIISNKSDLFLIKLPDSLKNDLKIYIRNAQFITTPSDSIYQLRAVSGMKYSHSKEDSVFNSLVEGTCPPSIIISIDFINTKSQQLILRNKFIAK